MLAVFWVVILVNAAIAVDAPPPGVPTAELKALLPGTTWTMSVDDGKGGLRRYTASVSDGVYEGRPVYRVSGGSNAFIYDKATFNMIARLSGERTVFSMQFREQVDKTRQGTDGTGSASLRKSGLRAHRGSFCFMLSTVRSRLSYFRIGVN